MTLLEFRASAEATEPGDGLHEIPRRGLVTVYWRSAVAGLPGWWWAVGKPSGQMLAGGWTAGNKRDRDGELERAVNRFAKEDGV